MYRKRNSTVVNPFPNSPIPSDLPEGFLTVSDFITGNQATLAGQMQPVTYNIPGLNVLIPTPQLFTDALNYIVREYGWLEISPQEQNYLTNDILANFRRLIQLLAMEQIFRMTDILRGEFGLQSYRATSNQAVSEALLNSLTDQDVRALSDIITEERVEGSTLTSEAGTYSSLGTGTGDRTYTGNTQVNNISTSKDLTQVGQVNQRTVELQHAFPTQAITGTTNNFPNAITTINVPSLQTPTGPTMPEIVENDLRVPDLNSAMANAGTSSFGVTEANEATMTTNQETDVNEDRSVEEQSTGEDTYDSQSTTRGNLDTRTTDNGFTTSTSSSQQTAIGSTESQNRSQMAGSYATKESGFNTVPQFARQLQYLVQLYLNNQSPWEWWLDRFTWLRGIY